MDDEIKTMFKQLLLVTEATRADVRALMVRADAQDGFNAKQEAFNAKQEAFNAKQEAFNAKQEAHNARVERELYEIKTDIKVINARLDEQGRVLTAMIPTRLAAVPAAE